MKNVRILVMAAIATVALTAGSIMLNSHKAYADTLSDLNGQSSSQVTSKNTSRITKPANFAVTNNFASTNSISENYYVYDIPGVQRVRYGTSGEGRPLYYYKIGNGSKTIIDNFAIHGFEDSWNQDGYQLTKMAHSLINKLKAQYDVYGLNDWSIIIIPAANPDGVLDGWTNNGPGRCQITDKIDLNRDFPTFFKPEYNSRNYTGSTPLEAPEAKALASLVSKVSRESKDTVLIDTHGWLNMTIGDYSVGRYFDKYFGFNENRGYIPTGHGYLISYGHAQGAEVSLVELPDTYSTSQITSRNYIGKMYDSILDLVVHGTNLQFMNKKGVVVNTSIPLNIRSGAATYTYKLGTYEPGSTVHIVGKIGNWYKVYKEGIGYAYVSADYINITGNWTGSATPTPDKPQTPSATAPSQYTTGTVVNTDIPLHIRQAATTNSAILGTYDPGSSVKIVAKEGDWYKIYKDGIGYAYVYAYYINENPTNNNNNNNNNSNAPEKYTTGTVVNTNIPLHIRQAATTNSAILGTYAPGSSVKIVSKEGDWYKVYKDGVGYAYVYAYYINENSSNSQYQQGRVINTNIPLHIRQAATTNSAIVGTYAPGSTVNLVSYSNGWYKVYRQDIGYAYVYGYYISK